jgi:antitoxin component of MazEF toxin-antitoxin module
MAKNKSSGKFKISRWAGNAHCIFVPAKIAEKFEGKPYPRALCTIKDHSFHCAFVKSKEQGYYVYLGKKLINDLKLRVGDEVNISFNDDKSENQAPDIEELTAVLSTDPEAEKIFNSLTPGNQRSLIYLVTLVKSSQKRIDRSLLIAAKLKAGITSARLMLK